MDKFIPPYYESYGRYSNYRNFPMNTDGLKPVERRVLMSAFKIAREKFVKTRQVDAYAIGHYHPHGDTYGTVVNLVKQGFLIGQGNFGSNVGIKPLRPAAPRYTECKLSPETIEMAFKYIKHVPWADTEMNDTEPLYLPTMFPLCLLGNENTQGIGFGYKTLVPCFLKTDLKKRLMWLLGKRKTEPIIEPKTDCKITADKQTLQQLLTTGKAKIDAEGIIEKVPHQNKVILKSWPPGKRFETFLNKFSDELAANMIGYIDSSVTETKIVFEVVRQRNRDSIFQEFLVKIKELLVGSISFDMVMVDENHKVVLMSIDKLLINVFDNYKKAVIEMFKHELSTTRQRVKDSKILMKMRPSLKRHMIGREDIKTKVESISADSGVLVEDVERLFQWNIKRLLSMDIDLDALYQKIDEIKKNLDNIDEYVLKQYDSI